MEEAQSWVSIKSVLWNSLNGYEYSIKAGTVDEERRRLAISNIHQPIVDGFYFTMIGWTTKTKEDVDQVCKSTMESFGGHNLMLNNCQHFLRNFAKDVVTEKGPDWAWFVESTLSSYKYKPITNALALAILTRFWQEKLRETVEIVGDG
ncbi:hypothetical protein ColTof4_13841 [Colletotrichum tofieldiae]|nr:hypothetical protein ColTof4_13841 [Colletotrichum tofieldiae]